MSIRACVHRLLNVLALLGLLLSLVQPLASAGPRAAAQADTVGRIANSSYSSTPATGLFRTRVTVRNPSDWARLEKLGVVILSKGAEEQGSAGAGEIPPAPLHPRTPVQTAVVLADEDQLEALARLRFEPQGTDELGMLVAAHAQAKPWLAAGLRPFMRAWEERGSLGLADLMREEAPIRASEKSVFSPELKAGLAALASVDDDGDGLTNTQEQASAAPKCPELQIRSILTAVQEALSTQPGYEEDSRFRLAPISAACQDDWAFADLVAQDQQTAQPAPITPGVALLRRSEGTWRVALPGTISFAEWLNQIPTTLLDVAAKDYLRGWSGPAFATAISNVTGYKLPWTGERRASVYCVENNCRLSNGQPYHNYPAADFAIVDNVVRASKSGQVVYRKDTSTDTTCTSSGCWTMANIVVIKSGGEHHWYMHLAPHSIPAAVQVGQNVAQGDIIGKQGNTGYVSPKSFRHLHFHVATQWGGICYNPGNPQAEAPCWPTSTSFARVDFAEISWSALNAMYDQPLSSQNGSSDPPPPPPPPLTDNAAFVADITIPDGTVFSPNQSFVKTWRLRNTGTSTWGAGYQLAFVGGNQLGAPDSVGLPRSVVPGEEVDISVNMMAPSSGGSYQGDWRMRNAQGIYFGDRVWVKISVPSGPEPTPPPGGETGDIEIVSVEYPSVVTPGQRFRPRVRVKVNQGQLLESRGDLLRNTDNNLYGAWPHVAVVGTINAGQTYTFEFYENNPITAPSGEGTYHSKWRVWRNGNWAGPEVDIRFDVRSGGGTRPAPPTLVRPSNWYISRDGSTPELCASAPAGLEYYFDIYESHDIPKSGWISNNCWTPPGLGIYGYQWHVKVRAPGTGLESDWSETRHFEIETQEVIIQGIFFSPGSPSAADEVGVWACVQSQGDIKTFVNTATDGSANGEWREIDHVIGVCNLDVNYPDRWPKWHTRPFSDGTHLVRSIGWRGTEREGNYRQKVIEATYTLQRRRPSDIEGINPDPDGWVNSRTVTFRWRPFETQRVNSFTFHVSTQPDPLINPIMTQTFGGSTYEYIYTFGSDYPSLYWRVIACNEIGCGSGMVRHFGIDRQPPSSAVEALSATSFETKIPVRWSGTDNVSGIRWYDIQVRDGERGEWTDWLLNTTDTVGIFTGQPGHTYYFHSRALDMAGNLENYPGGNGDTATIIDLAARPPSLWWDSAYAFKRAVLVQNRDSNTLPAGYPVHLHFDSTTAPTAAQLYAASASTVKGDDFRIIYNDQAELPRFINTFTTNQIDIWFKNQVGLAPSASNSNYQLYYGNPTASNPPGDIDQVMPPGKDANTVAIWHFHEGSGTTVSDSSGKGHHGTAIGPTAWGSDGKFGNYMVFDRIGDVFKNYVRVASSSDFDVSALTAEAWIYYPPNGGGALIWRPLAPPDGCPAFNFRATGQNVWLGINCESGRIDAGTIPLNTWSHVAGTYDRNTIKVYLNGRLLRSTNYSDPIHSASGRPLFIGGEFDTPNFWGFVQHARLSNVARTDFGQVQQLVSITNEPNLEAGAQVEPPGTGVANLAVDSITTYPAAGGGALVQAVMTNQGSASTKNGFYIDLYADHEPAGPGDLTGSIRYYVASPVEAGEMITLTALVTDTSPAALALAAPKLPPLSEVTSTLYVQADSNGVISETNKADNISPGAEVCFAAADAFEADDTAASATLINPGGAAQIHNCHGVGDEDWFRFTATGGVSYIFYTGDLGLSADTYLYVYDTDATTLLAANDDYGGSLASHIEWQALASGTYYVVVKHWNPNVGGCGTGYNITVRMLGDLDGNCAVEAADIQTMASLWRQAAGSPRDLNGDGRITVADITRVAAEWGMQCVPDIEILSVDYPREVTPGQSFRPSVTVRVNRGQLLESRGDMLRNTDGNLYGAWPHVTVVGTVNVGQTYTFEFYGANPITAPTSEGTYESRWRVWRDGNWDGPEITIRFEVSGGTPPSDIAANWHLDEGQGQVAVDSSQHGNNGQLGSSPSADSNDPTWISGKYGSALRFDGDDFVEVADSAFLEPSEITVEAWVRHLGSPGGSSYIVSKGALECLASSYALYTSGGLSFYVFNGSGGFAASPGAGDGVWDGNWHHVAGMYDGSTVRLYVDGVEVGSGTPTTLSIGYGLPTNDRFYIGTYRGTCNLAFNGDIDEVRVWTRALLPSEVALRAQGQELGGGG